MDPILLQIMAERPCPKMIARFQLIDLLFVIAPHSLLLDIAGVAEAFRLANLHRETRGLPPRFRLRFSGPLANVRSSVGLELGGLEPLPQRLTTPTWVVWGSTEQAEFARQSGNYQAAALALGNPVELSGIAGADHFSVIHGLEDPSSPVCRWLHRQLTS